MKELTVTCVVKHGTQMWWKDPQTGETYFTLQPTSPGYEFKEDEVEESIVEKMLRDWKERATTKYE